MLRTRHQFTNSRSSHLNSWQFPEPRLSEILMARCRFRDSCSKLPFWGSHAYIHFERTVARPWALSNELLTGAPNTTGAYELDPSIVDSGGNWSTAWRSMHVSSDIFCSASLTLPDKAGRQINIGGWALGSTFGIRKRPFVEQSSSTATHSFSRHLLARWLSRTAFDK